MTKANKIYDGVSIKIYDADEPDKVIVSFTDDITAYYKIKKAIIRDKGLYCNGISCMIFEQLRSAGVPVHFIKKLSDTDLLCKKVDVIPMEVIVRNVIAGSMAQRLGLKEGLVPAEPVYDICYKSEELGDPIINDYHAVVLGLVTKDELSKIYEIARKVNAVLTPLFKSVGITLVDFKIEFGRDADGSLVLSDEITPDSARFWDSETGMKLDKDRFRYDAGKVGCAYKTVYERLCQATGTPVEAACQEHE